MSKMTPAKELFDEAVSIVRGDRCPTCRARWEVDGENKFIRIMTHAATCSFMTRFMNTDALQISRVNPIVLTRSGDQLIFVGALPTDGKPTADSMRLQCSCGEWMILARPQIQAGLDQWENESDDRPLSMCSKCFVEVCSRVLLAILKVAAQQQAACPGCGTQDMHEDGCGVHKWVHFAMQTLADPKHGGAMAKFLDSQDGAAVFSQVLGAMGAPQAILDALDRIQRRHDAPEDQ